MFDDLGLLRLGKVGVFWKVDGGLDLGGVLGEEWWVVDDGVLDFGIGVNACEVLLEVLGDVGFYCGVG